MDADDELEKEPQEGEQDNEGAGIDDAASKVSQDQAQEISRRHPRWLQGTIPISNTHAETKLLPPPCLIFLSSTLDQLVMGFVDQQARQRKIPRQSTPLPGVAAEQEIHERRSLTNVCCDAAVHSTRICECSKGKLHLLLPRQFLAQTSLSSQASTSTLEKFLDQCGGG